jgi:hypothetical protein
MEPWAGVVSAVAVGLVAGLLVFSAGITGRLLLRAFPPPPKASQLTPPHTGEKRITIAPRTRDATRSNRRGGGSAAQRTEQCNRERSLSALSADPNAARHPGAGGATATAAGATAGTRRTFVRASATRWPAAASEDMLCVERRHVDDPGGRLRDGCHTPGHSKLSPLRFGDDHIHSRATARPTHCFERSQQNPYN